MQLNSKKVSRRHCCLAQVHDYLVIREIGLAFDRSVGVPCIPGSSVKGLCRAAARLGQAERHRGAEHAGAEQDDGVQPVQRAVLSTVGLPALGQRPQEANAQAQEQLEEHAQRRHHAPADAPNGAYLGRLKDGLQLRRADIAEMADLREAGVHLREATAEERAAYLAQPCRFPKSPRAFAVPVRVGDVLIDEDTGPGSWHGGAGF